MLTKSRDVSGVTGGLFRCWDPGSPFAYIDHIYHYSVCVPLSVLWYLMLSDRDGFIGGGSTLMALLWWFVDGWWRTVIGGLLDIDSSEGCWVDQKARELVVLCSGDSLKRMKGLVGSWNYLF